MLQQKKKLKWFLIPILTLSLCFQPAVTKTAAAADQTVAQAAAQDMKGIYVSTVLNLDYPAAPTTDSAQLKAQIDSIVTNCSNLGMNSIFFQVRPCTDAFYQSSIFPWSKYATGVQGIAPSNGFDPLAYFITQAHAKKMTLHAWVNPYRITKNPADWNTLAANNPAKLHPEWVKVYTDGNYYFDPGIPAVRSLIESGVQELITNYDLDGIHMDDYFYPGIAFPDDATFAAFNNNQFSNKADWRRNNVNLLIQELDYIIHSYNPNLQFGISPSGVWENQSANPLGSPTKGGHPSYSKLFADTRKWALEGWIDYIAPQIYWENGHKLCDYATLQNWWATTLAGSDTKLYIALANYRANDASATSPWYNGAEISRQMLQNKQNPNVSGEIHFRYGTIMSNPSMIASVQAGNK